MNKIIITILASAFTFSVATAQEKWSLNKCIDYAKEHNINIKMNKLDVEVQANNTKQSKLNLLPNVNGNMGYSFSYGRSLSANNTYEQQNTQGGNVGISASVGLFNGFQKQNAIKQNQLNLKASLQDVEKAKEDLSINITSSYLDILFKKELLQVAQEKLKVTKQQIYRSEQLVEVGKLPKGTLMEQKAQQAREELEVVNAQNYLDLALLNLAQLLDLESVNGFDIVKPELPVINANKSMMTPESIFASAVNVRPEMKAANYRLKSAEKGLAIAKGSRLPSLSMSGSWGSSYSKDFPEMGIDAKGNAVLIRKEMRLSDQLKNRENKGFGFSLSIPIFNGGSVNRDIANARLNIERNNLSIANAKNELRKQIQQAYANARAAMNKYFSSEEAINSSEEAFRYTQEKFNLGLVNSVDYNQEKNNLFQAKSNLLQAKYEYIFRAKILDFYNGVAIEL